MSACWAGAARFLETPKRWLGRTLFLLERGELLDGMILAVTAPQIVGVFDRLVWPWVSMAHVRTKAFPKKRQLFVLIAQRKNGCRKDRLNSPSQRRHRVSEVR